LSLDDIGVGSSNLANLPKFNVEQFEALQALGVDYSQGYLTGKPELLYDPTESTKNQLKLILLILTTPLAIKRFIRDNREHYPSPKTIKVYRSEWSRGSYTYLLRAKSETLQTLIHFMIHQKRQH